MKLHVYQCDVKVVGLGQHACRGSDTGHADCGLPKCIVDTKNNVAYHMDYQEIETETIRFNFETGGEPSLDIDWHAIYFMGER